MGKNTLKNPELASTKDVRTEMQPKDYVIPSIPQKLPPEKYNLFNRIIGTVDWKNCKGGSALDELRTFYEAIYPYIDMVTGDNESLHYDHKYMLKTNAEMISYLKESNQWHQYLVYLKNQSSEKSVNT